MKTVLFLCTGNSCRSQLAEAIVNKTMTGKWLAFSAGTHPSGYIHPMTLEVLKEINIEHQGHSKSVDQFRHQQFDLVITVCDDADENCPVWLGSGKRIHVGFSDPAKISGTSQEISAAFRIVRDQIRSEILKVLEDHQ